MTLSAPVLHTGSSSATAQATYTTASTTPPTGSRVLLWVASAKGSNLALSPTGVTHPSIAMTKVLETGSPNSNVKLTLWTGVGSGMAGAFTISHSTAMDKCLWQVVSLASDVATPTIAQSQVASNSLSGSQGATLDAAPKTGSCVLGAFGYNSSDAPTVGSGFTAIGTRLSQTSPVSALWSEYDLTPPLPTTAPFTYGAATGRGMAVVEVADGFAAPTGPTVTLWTGTAEVPVTRVDYWNGTTLTTGADVSVAP